MTDEQLTYTDEGTHVYVINPDTGGVWECPVDYLPIARLRGWEPTTKPVTDVSHLFDAATPAGTDQTGFDPADHNVEEINTYLLEHLDSPGEIERVLELEKAGKDRTTVHDPRPQVDTDDTK